MLLWAATDRITTSEFLHRRRVKLYSGGGSHATTGAITANDVLALDNVFRSRNYVGHSR